MKPKVGTGLIGAAGEYYVAAELSKRNWLATVTIKNAPGTDVLARHSESGHVIAVQAKTAAPGTTSWALSKDNERGSQHPNEWYAFVALRDPQARPEFYLVPRDAVAMLASVTHALWSFQPGVRGQPHKESETMRRLPPAALQAFHEGWAALESAVPTQTLPITPWLLDAASRGVPDAAWVDGYKLRNPSFPAFRLAESLNQLRAEMPASASNNAGPLAARTVNLSGYRTPEI